MSEKAKVINLKNSDNEKLPDKQIHLDSGYNIVTKCQGEDDLLEIAEPKGEIVLRILLTAEGPVVQAHGTHIELKSSETLTMSSKKVKIEAEEEVIINSKESVKLNCSKNIDVHSDKDVNVTGEMIYLN